MIYIDPPYNTDGDGFVYNDDRKYSPEQIAKIANLDKDESQRLFKFLSKEQSSHSAWCVFMYPRLKLARNLLKDDGVIFISIDDNEQAVLKLLCDEVFGEENFVANIAVASNSSKNNSNFISISHEYLFCYVKNIDYLKSHNVTWQVLKNNLKEYEKRVNQLLERNLSFDEIHEELLELVKYPRFYDFDHYTYADEKGIFQTDNPGGVKNGNTNIKILHPVTGKVCAMPDGGWRYKKEYIDELLKNNELAFGIDESIVPRPKRYLKDYNYQTPKSVVFFDSQSSTKWLKNNGIIFDFPKSIDLLKYAIQISQANNNDIILDFFAGSGTTAHAVMDLNAKDGGNRKFILVQLDEKIDEKKNKTAYDFCKNELKSANPTIFDITKERIIRASKKIKSESVNLLNNELDLGFKIYEICENKRALPVLDDEISLFENLNELSDKDDLNGVLNAFRVYDRVKLEENAEILDLNGYEAYKFENKIYLINPNFKSENLKKLLEKIDNDKGFNPEKIVVYGLNFDSIMQREIAENIKNFSSKKELKIRVLIRY